MRLIHLNKLHTEVLCNTKQPILMRYSPLCASVPVQAPSAKKIYFSSSLSFRNEIIKKCWLSPVHFVFSRREASLSAPMQLYIQAHSIHPPLVFFLFLAPYTSNAILFQRTRHMCIFLHSWIPDIQFGGNHLHVKKTEGQRLEEVRRWSFQNMYGGLIAPNLWRPRKNNTSFKEHTQKVSPKECSPSPVGIIIWL